jgi:hypothetical protein
MADSAEGLSWIKNCVSVGFLFWFFYGLIIEIIFDFDLIDKLEDGWVNDTLTYGSQGYPLPELYLNSECQEVRVNQTVTQYYDMHVDSDWLLVVTIFGLVGTSCVACLLCGLTVQKMVSQNSEESAEPANISKLIVMCKTIILSFSMYKLVVYGSLLNKFRYLDIWTGSGDFMLHDYDYILSLFFLAPYTTIAGLVKAKIVQTSANILRSMFLGYLMESSWKFWPIVGVPWLAFTLLAFMKDFSSVMVFHFTQRCYTQEGILDATESIDLGVVNFMFGLYAFGAFWKALSQWMLIDFCPKFEKCECCESNSLGEKGENALGESTKANLYQTPIMCCGCGVISIIVSAVLWVRVSECSCDWDAQKPYFDLDISLGVITLVVSLCFAVVGIATGGEETNVFGGLE